MNSRIKNRWISLLESGEYNFGTGRLYNSTADCHCAVGVLLEMAIDEGVYEPKLNGLRGLESIHPMHLNQDIREWAGLSIGKLDFISSVNDSSGSYARVIRHIRRLL